MYLDKRSLYMIAFADIQKIHAESGTTTKQLIWEVERVTERLSSEWPCNDCKRTVFCGACERPGIWMEKSRKKLAEYETAEEEGRLVVLPCKVRDTVWVITHPFNVFDDFDFYEDAHDEIYESYISSVTFYEDSNQCRIYAKETKQFIKAYFMESDFGKTVFLTREEAEKALKEMEGK